MPVCCTSEPMTGRISSLWGDFFSLEIPGTNSATYKYVARSVSLYTQDLFTVNFSSRLHNNYI